MGSDTYTILLADDDPVILIGIGQELESEGYGVYPAKSGESALEIIGNDEIRIDLVITDLIMGGINGIQVLRKSKKINPDCMVMILTGYGELDSAIQAIRLGADDYMLKPGSPEERSFRIKELLEKYEMRRKIKLYEKILPICCMCKQIRDDSGKIPGEGDWMSVEDFLFKRGNVQITSSYCPECYEKIMEGFSK